VICLPAVILWVDLPVSLPVVLPFALWAGWQGVRATRAGLMQVEAPNRL